MRARHRTRATCSPHDHEAIEHTLHVREGLTPLQPARLAGVIGVGAELPPPHELSSQASPGEAVTSCLGAFLDLGAGVTAHSVIVGAARQSARSRARAAIRLPDPPAEEDHADNRRGAPPMRRGAVARGVRRCSLRTPSSNSEDPTPDEERARADREPDETDPGVGVTPPGDGEPDDRTDKREGQPDVAFLVRRVGPPVTPSTPSRPI